MRLGLVAILLMCALVSAQAAQVWIFNGGTGGAFGSHGRGPISGGLLLENATDNLLLEAGGANNLCLEGGC